MILPAIIITILLSVFYFFFILFLIYFWDKTEDVCIPEDYLPTQAISVIIPVRNESENIVECLHSVLDNNFPSDLLQVIVVDDNSTDNTVELIAAIKNEKLVFVSMDSDLPGGKKKAIEKGIEISSAEFIVQTDGDVIVPEKWLLGISFLLEKKGKKLVTGPVIYSDDKTNLQAFQSLELTGLMLFTGVGITTGIFYLSNGANMAYTKSIYMSLSEWRRDDLFASGDDVFLIQELSKIDSEGIAFIKSPHLAVRTKGMDKIKDFVSQRHRWATKTRFYKDLNLKIILGLIFIFCLIIPINFILGIFFNTVFLMLAIFQILIKFLADYVFLQKSSAYFNLSYLMKKFIPSFFIHLIYIIFAGLAGLFIKNFSWKGRKLQ